MNNTIFVSGASGIVGYGILKALKKYNQDIILVGATVHEESVAPAFCHIFEKAPYTSDETYFEWLADVIKKHQVDLLIPSIESDVFAWNQNREFFAELGVCPLLNGNRLITLCKDKWHFYQELEEHNSPYAINTSLEFDSDINSFPLLLKPRRGYASQGIVVVEDTEELTKYRDEIGANLVIQPIVGNVEEEYTTSAFFDSSSTLCAHMTLRRKLSKQGFTEIAYTVELPTLPTVLQELADIFKPVGPTNFQFRIEGEQLKLLEINPRISSATSIRTAFGYNESQMSVEYFLYGEKPTQPEMRTGRSVRYTEDIVFYDRTDI
ncbi:ATP-grasp domain-containing protein [uncultured Pseudodesulfovibrio sp.]|uniref:ATP-grasp domain-containing protein n=1 Tax=uncultured Pseudodesulfovibrio sp. TaxID=2035858 RepID=UPI0029C66C7C|nr:ATP-grasp domain-containing protein [uncultured Pseudodesulfovibrio sp.]